VPQADQASGSPPPILQNPSSVPPALSSAPQQTGSGESSSVDGGAPGAEADGAMAAAAPGAEASAGEKAAVPEAAIPPASEPALPVEVNPIPAEYFRPSEIDGPLRALLALFVIGFGVWVVNHWTKYDKYSGQTEQGWHKGSKQMVEITLVREDKTKLDCASDIIIEGLGCAYTADSQPRNPPLPKDKTLHPYCNIKNDVLLAAGLWDSPGLQGELPTERFTVVCNYSVVGVVKSVSVRWNIGDKFDPAKQSLPVGILTDCVIPQ